MTMLMDHYYHTTVALATLLALSDDELRGMLRLRDEPLTPYQVRVTAQHFVNRGYAYLPTCNRVDATGLCQGHPEISDVTAEVTNHVPTTN